MVVQMREFRFFISSTFKDMQQERDVIRNDVMPEIELFANKLNVTVSIVDLRWGISTENIEGDEASFKIFRTCFDEIDDARPFFIGLIGNRYGWIPDLSQFPLQYDAKFKDFLKYKGKSITESEMHYAIDTYEKDGLFIFAFRDKIIGQLNKEEEDIYLSSSEEDERNITTFKKYLKDEKPEDCFSYSPSIDNGVLDLKDFAKQIIKLIKAKILFATQNIEIETNPIATNIEAQQLIIESTHQYFSGREEMLEKYRGFEKDHKFIAIQGESGFGKSSFIQELAFNSLHNPETYTLFFLAGSTDNSKDIRFALISLLYQSGKLLNTPLEDKYCDIKNVDDDYNELINRLSFNLASLSKIKPVYIFIDALDQFNANNEALLKFINTRYFLINNLDIHVITTFIAKDYIKKELIFKLFTIIEMPPLTDEDVIKISEKKLAREKKTLTSNCIEALKNNKNNSSPLYLSILLQEIINLNYLDFSKIEEMKKNMDPELAIYSYIESIIVNAPNNINGLFFKLVDDAKEKIGEEFVYYSLGILSMSRKGVREIDIYSIFEQLGMSFNSSDFSYLRRMFRHFISTASFYYDFNHKIIDNCLEDYYFIQQKESSIKISEATIRYLDSISDEDAFKQKEYLFYAYKCEKLDIFVNYLESHLNEVTAESFFQLFEEMNDSNIVNESFFKVIKKTSNNTISYLLDKSEIANYPNRKKYFTLLLEKNDLSKENKIDVYIKLSQDEYSFGKDRNADLLSHYAIKYAYHNNVNVDKAFIIRCEVLIKLLQLGKFKRLLKKSKDIVSKDVFEEYTNKYKVNKNPNQVFEIDNFFNEEKDVIDFIKKAELKTIFENRQLLEFALSKYHSLESIELLKEREKQHFTDSLNKGIDEIVHYSYIPYLISVIYFSLGEKEEGKIYIKKSYDLIKTIGDLLENKAELTLLNDVIHLMKKSSQIKRREEKEVYKSTIKRGVVTMNYNDQLATKVLYLLAGASYFFVLIILGFGLRIFQLEISNILDNNGSEVYSFVFVTYLFEILTFLSLFPTSYCLLTYLFADHHYSRYAKANLLQAVIFFVLSLINAIIFYLLQVQTIDPISTLEELMFMVINSICGGFGASLLVLAIRNFSKNNLSFYDLIEFKSLKIRRITMNISIFVAVIAIAAIQSNNTRMMLESLKGKNIDVGFVSSFIANFGTLALIAVGVILYIVSLIRVRRLLRK